MFVDALCANWKTDGKSSRLDVPAESLSGFPGDSEKIGSKDEIPETTAPGID